MTHLVIEGQATLAYEILEQAKRKLMLLSYLLEVEGLISGVLSVFKQLSPETKLLVLNHRGSFDESKSLTNNTITSLDKIDPFVDGASVKK